MLHNIKQNLSKRDLSAEKTAFKFNDGFSGNKLLPEFVTIFQTQKISDLEKRLIHRTIL